MISDKILLFLIMINCLQDCIVNLMVSLQIFEDTFHVEFVLSANRLETSIFYDKFHTVICS